MSDRCHHSTGDDSTALVGNCPACLLEIGLRNVSDDELSQWATAVLDESSSDSRATATDAQSLTPGTLVARRFRVSGIIGRGGMGEVYRADDLKLGQTVALKFLPRGPEASAALEALLYEEVRIGRQIAHPNVCRIYDLIEVEGQHAVVMELVDGEDLASLIRRIGQLPYAKALNIARDICAGVGAAHEKGIVHGDLKPANVMIDGAGRARITDFGLSRAAEEGRQRVHAGTIAYMAPEQLRLGNSTRRTDMYALGAVLYELFTGHRLHDGGERTESPPPRPSVEQPLLDAALEDAILRCLSPNPDERPESAKSLLQVIPGGDVLDVALAAGEVPTPDVVASSGKLRELSVPDAWLLLGFALAALYAVVIFSDALTLYGRAGLHVPPTTLSNRASILAGTLAGFAGARDRGYRFEPNLDDATISFHFRADAARLLPLSPDGRVNIESSTAGESTVDVVLSADGRLLKLRSGSAKLRPPDTWQGWNRLLSAAALDQSNLIPIVSDWAPPVQHDRKQEWRAGLAKVRAAASRSSIVWFDIVPGVDSTPGLLNESKIPHLIYLWLLIASLAAGAYLARHNIRSRRIDGRAALRIAGWTFGCRALYGLLVAHHSLSLENETALLGLIGGASILLSAQVWLAYAALEPYVRKLWPETLVGWSRMVQGRLRDPLIGRDLLAGASLGLLYRLIDHVRNAVPLVSDLRVAPSHLAVDALASTREGIGTIFYSQSRAIFYGLFALFILVLLRTILRNGFVAGAVWLIAMTAIWSRWDDPRVAIPTTAAQMGVLLLALHRAGLLAATTALFVQLVTAYVPLTADPGAFWFPQSAIAVALIAAIVFSGFYWSMAGRPLFASMRGRAVPAST